MKSEQLDTARAGEIFYKGREPYKYHIVGVLSLAQQVIYRYYGKRKQWWHYEVEHMDSFKYCFEIGIYSNIRKRYETNKH
jgi:hypothetical protein